MVRALILRAADLISPPPPPPPGGWRNELPEAFAALNADASIMCIGYKGEWYWIRKPSWRVRIHNRLISAATRDHRTDVHIANFHWHAQ